MALDHRALHECRPLLPLCVLLALAVVGCETWAAPDEPAGSAGQAPGEASSSSSGSLGSWETRLRGAERIVVATVRQVSAAYGVNEYGDKLIFSEITLEVDENLRGDAARTTTFLLEGGTVGDITLTVSDLPKLVPGDHGVFALRRSSVNGDVWLPHNQSLGIILAPADVDLKQIQQLAKALR